MRKFLSGLCFWRDHRWARDRLSAYLDGELGERWRTHMERHVGQCADCRRLAAELSLLIDVLHRLHPLEGGPNTVQIAAAVRSQLAEPPDA